VADPTNVERVVADGSRHFGPITVLVNNAGIAGVRAPTAEIAIEDHLNIMAVNANGTFYGMRAVIPGMLAAGGGSIVNVSSTAGFNFVSAPNLAYAGSKFAIRGMTKAAAVEYAGRGIRVNSVHPGGVLTPMVAKGLTEEEAAGIAADIPMGRLAEPRELSEVVVFLASDASSYMTGSAVLVDGGLLR
jgi:3alpha(or 20beta)-hydroxysteroid dehydrogenase